MSSEYDAFMRHILENPEDYVARSVFADWLEENAPTADSPLWACAHSIRLGIEISNLDKLHPEYKGRLNDLTAKIAHNYWGNPTEKERLSLGFSRLPLFCSKDQVPKDITVFMGLPNYHAAIFDRGFVSELVDNRDHFYENAVGVFEQHPITKIRIIDFAKPTSSTLRSFRGTNAHNPQVTFNIKKIGRVYIEANGPTPGNVYHEELISDLLVDVVRNHLELPPIHIARLRKTTGLAWSVDVKPH